MSASILSLEGVRLSFGHADIIRGASFSIREGEIHALIGPNGAGKSTLFHLISGRLAPNSGHIRFRGRDIAGARPSLIARLGLSRSFQQTSAFPSLTVAENLAIAVMGATGERGSILRTSAAMPAVWARVEALLEKIGLARFADRIVANLAYSEQRILEIGLACAGDPALILLDEPTAGMSRAETEEMVPVLSAIARGRTLVLVEHDMEVVFRIADTVTVLVHGEVLASGSPAVIRSDPRVRQAYLGQTPEVAHG